MPISKSSLFGLFVSALALRAKADDVPYNNYPEKFTGLNVLDGPYGGASFGLQDIPGASYTAPTKRPLGTLPQKCYERTGSDTCSPENMEVYEVNYNDCNEPAIICRCTNAGTSLTTLTERISRIPVKARQLISHWTAFPGDGCGGIYYANGVVGLFGTCTAQSVYFHEVGHAMDQYVAGANTGYFWYSDSPDWRNKIASDSCVPDSYAKAGYIEAYAQSAVMSAYHANVQNIWSLDVGCMAGQMATVNEQLIDKGQQVFKYRAGATCDLPSPSGYVVLH
ncbi:hypothetical protein BJ508DRAFT_217547 [Ascobolus immersus RN42]|uniref:Zincin n=1 Tax=Ascobolus immersus RN42 TaxID=1160509 RepID=A0A3N4HC06_ASCIM|nr:hypothetical protein BJ508DRAFT_217547 [Ascobolus immersus RN42]